MMYNNTVRDYFFSPRHAGVIDLNQKRTIVFKDEQKGQGNIEVYMHCGEDKIIQNVCFKTNGGPYLIAALEWLSRRITGHFIDSLPLIDYQILIKTLDIPTPHYPLALRVVRIFEESLILMNHKLSTIEDHK
jgi:nitrogen fixation NifU-like protein